MRIFLTGASGFVGTAVLAELMKHGHSVLGLVRSDAGATIVKSLGGDVLRGDLEDLECLRTGAAQADGVIHCGFNHDFSKFQANCENDRAAIAAMGEVLAKAGGNKPFLVTSGTAMASNLPNRELATENHGPGAEAAHNPRAASEQLALDFASKGVRVIIVRLPPSVHDEGDHGFVPMLIAMSREKKAAAYIGDGANVWPAVHRRDAARAYRLALEKGASGTRVHPVGDEPGVPFKQIATTIGKRLNVPVISVTGDEVASHFGWFAHFAGLDNPTSTKLTRERLGWAPEGSSLMEDVDSEKYFPKSS